MSITKNKVSLKLRRKQHLKPQQGKVSLQTVFWVVGIIVGLLSIAQFVMTYLNNETEGSTDKIATTDVSQPKEVSSSTETPLKPKITDSPSTKIDNYTVYENGIAVDDDLGIMWMRCSLGQEWNGSHCEGSAKAYSLEEATQAIDKLNTVSYVGLYDWRLPDIEAMQSLIDCSEGYSGSYQIPLKSGVKKTVEASCAGDYKVPAIKDDVFPDTQWSAWRGYWSSSQNDKGEPLTVYFDTGDIKTSNKKQYVRAMRYVQSD